MHAKDLVLDYLGHVPTFNLMVQPIVSTREFMHAKGDISIDSLLQNILSHILYLIDD